MGGFGFVYPIIFTDSNGIIQNALLEIKDGSYIISLNKSWADMSKLPLRANDTFGNTIYLYKKSLDYNQMGLSKYPLSVDGDVTKLTVRVYTSAGTLGVKGVIYDDDGAGGIPGTLKGVTEITNITTTADWYDLTFSSPISLTTGDWWLGIIGSNVTVNFHWAETGASRLGYDSYNSPTNPWSASSRSTETHDFAIYATYTAGGGVYIPFQIIKNEKTDYNRGNYLNGYYRNPDTRFAMLRRDKITKLAN